MLSFQFLSNCLGRSAVANHHVDDFENDIDDGDYTEEEKENDDFDDTLNIFKVSSKSSVSFSSSVYSVY